jgi:hypothetical protein
MSGGDDWFRRPGWANIRSYFPGLAALIVIAMRRPWGSGLLEGRSWFFLSDPHFSLFVSPTQE